MKRVLLLLSVLIFSVFWSCSIMTSTPATASGSYCTFTVSVQPDAERIESSTSARAVSSVMPSYEKSSLFYTFSYTATGSAVTYVYPDAGTAAAYSDFIAHSFSLLAQTYDFTLRVYSDSSCSALVLTQTLSSFALSQSTTSLSFTSLSEPESASSANGSVSVPLSFPAAAHVTGVSARLVPLTAMDTVVDTASLTSSTAVDGSCTVTYSKNNLPPGLYILHLSFTSSDSEQPTVISLMVKVASGSTSRPDSNEAGVTSGVIELDEKVMNVHYTVTYENMSESSGSGWWKNVAVVQRSFVQGQTVQLPLASQVSRTGYSFGGWYTSESLADGSEIAQTPNTLSENITVYAKWTPITYTVTFNAHADSFSGEMASLSCTYDSEASLPENAFTRSGYTFAGWNTQADGSGLSYADGESFSNLASQNGATVTLYAQWTPVSYTINYSLGDGASWVTGFTAPASYTIEESLTLPDAASVLKTGFGFAGWYEDEALTGTLVTRIDEGTTGDKTFYASWAAGAVQYAVHHWLQPVSGETALASYSEVTEDALTLTGITGEETAAVANNYAGFTAQPIVQQTIAADGSSVVHIYYDRNTITYTFSADGGVWSDGTSADKAVSGLYGAPVTAPETTRTGYSFAAWSSDVPETFGTSDAAFTATWTPITYAISYSLGDGASWAAGFTAPASYTIEDSFELPAAAAVGKTGYVFAGWYEDETLTGDAVSSIASGTTGDKTFYASWAGGTVQYAVRHWLQPVSGETALASYSEVTEDVQTLTGTTGTETAAVANNYAGFTAQPITQQTIAADGSSVVHVYYDRNTITYTFSALGGVWSDGTSADKAVSGLYGASVTAPETTRTGYSFAAWSSDVPETFGASDSSFTAIWTPITYAITYELSGGENAQDNPESYTIESADITLSSPTKAGYTFTGWYLDSSFTESASGIASGSTGDKTFYACWTAASVSVNVSVPSGAISVSTATDSSSVTLIADSGYTDYAWIIDDETSAGCSFATVSSDGRTLTLDVDSLLTGAVYQISVSAQKNGVYYASQVEVTR